MSQETIDRLLDLFDRRLRAQSESIDKLLGEYGKSVDRLATTVGSLGDQVKEHSGKIDELEVLAARADDKDQRRWVGVRTRALEDDREVVEFLLALPVRRGMMVAIGTAALVALAGWLGLSL